MNFLYRLADWFDPAACLICGQSQSWLCPFCSAKIQAPRPHCFSCGCPDRLGLCLDCSPNWAFDGLIISGNYSNPHLRQLIKAYKYRFTRQLAKPLTLILAKAYDQQAAIRPGSSQAAVIPVPLHHKRERWRGFNQSQLLAKNLAIIKQWPLLHGLKRKKSDANQAELSEIERAHNLIDAFYWTGPKLEGQEIILIDDVITSGQTLNQAARALKKAGAEYVWGLILAGRQKKIIAG